MAEQQQNQFITHEQQQRQYLIDLIAAKRRKNHRETAAGAAQRVLDRVASSIEDGIFKIEQAQVRVEDLLEARELSDSVKRMLSNQKKREDKIRQNNLLYPKKKSLSTLQDQSYPQSILSAEKHREFMRQIKLEKVKRQQKIAQLKQRQEVQRQKSFTELQKTEEQQRLQQIQRKKLQIQQSLQKMRENHQQLLLNERQSKTLVNRIRHKKRLHEYLKQTYEQRIVLPMLEQNKKILEERKENSRLSLEEIESHEKQYLQWKKSQQSLEKSSVSKTSYHPPPHSKKISRILAEEERNKHTLDMQKQRIKQKMERVNNYTSLLRKRQITQAPTVSKTIATTDRQKSQKTELSRRESGNRNNLGNKYLEDARRALRKRAKTQLGEQTTLPEKKTPKKKETTLSLSNIDATKRERPIQRSKKEQIERMLNCAEYSAQQKLKRMREADEMLSTELKKKEERLKLRFNRNDNQLTVDLLLAAVRAKMNLLDCYERVQS